MWIRHSARRIPSRNPSQMSICIPIKTNTLKENNIDAIATQHSAGRKETTSLQMEK